VGKRVRTSRCGRRCPSPDRRERTGAWPEELQRVLSGRGKIGDLDGRKFELCAEDTWHGILPATLVLRYSINEEHHAPGADMSAKFEIYEDQAGEWRWRLRARNGEIVGTSGEGYKQLASARRAVQLVKQSAGDAIVEENAAPKKAKPKKGSVASSIEALKGSKEAGDD
jgi:uncharacterized protein YegP (UPF0339 family)